MNKTQTSLIEIDSDIIHRISVILTSFKKKIQSILNRYGWNLDLRKYDWYQCQQLSMYDVDEIDIKIGLLILGQPKTFFKIK